MSITKKESNIALSETVAIIAVNCQRIRMENGMTIKQLSEEIGSYHQTVARIESGKGHRHNEAINVPAIQTLIRISKVCNVCITEFFKPIPCQK